jgi:hypothetical protein
MTFLWAVRAIDISCCVVTGSDFPALHAYLYLAIPEPTLPSVGEAGNDQLEAARQMTRAQPQQQNQPKRTMISASFRPNSPTRVGRG